MQWENILHMAALIAAAEGGRRRALVVVEQNLAFAERIADRYLVMDQGRAMLEGSRSEIEREPRARASARLNKVRKAVCWAAALI